MDRTANQKCLDIIVPGRRLTEDGRISEIFRYRLDRAVEVYRRRLERFLKIRLIVSGGDLGQRGITEAAAGGEYLRTTHRIDSEHLVLEENALDTVSNAVYCKILLLESGCRMPIVVSSCYHIPRVSYLFSHILGPDFIPTYISAATGLSPADYTRHWRSESHKMIEAVQFIDRIDARPGDHDRLDGYLRSRPKINSTSSVA